MVSKCVICILLEYFLVTVHKQSLEQGNIFTSMCHSVHRGEIGWLPSMHHRSHYQGVCLQGGLHPGGLHPGGLARPPSNQILLDMVNEHVVRILLGCILVSNLNLSISPPSQLLYILKTCVYIWRLVSWLLIGIFLEWNLV